MERKNILTELNIIYFIYIMFAVGIVGHSFKFSLILMLTLTPIVLLLIGTVICVYMIINKNYRILYWCMLIYLLTLILEIIGVKSGIIFGEYKYGNTLGLKFFEVPLIIGFNWMFVILGAINLSAKLFRKKITIIIFSALFSIIFDIILEPVAIKFDYWHWQQIFVPMQNYLAWFIISFFSALVFYLFKTEIKNINVFMNYFFAQFIFFFYLNFV